MHSAAAVDRILRCLRQAETYVRNTPVALDQNDLLWLCTEAIKVLRAEPSLLYIEAPICFCGDLHGQFYDLLHFMKLGGQPPDTTYLFLGDYVDRGHNSVETFSYLLSLKVKYPKNIFLLRGNHETYEISSLYGFRDECQERYSDALYNRFCEVFQYLPFAAVIGKRIFCVHGGLSREMRDVKDIANQKRPVQIPETGMLVDLLWADPCRDHTGFEASERGTSYTYGPDVVDDFLKRHDYDLVCRAHQVVQRGYDFPYHPTQTVLTVFSAPDYCDEFANRAAMLKVDQELKCSFEFIDPPRSRTLGSGFRPATPQSRISYM